MNDLVIRLLVQESCLGEGKENFFSIGIIIIRYYYYCISFRYSFYINIYLLHLIWTWFQRNTRLKL